MALESQGVITAYEPALYAIRSADLIVLGPGSLFTSIVSCLIVPGVEDAIRESRAPVVFVGSLADYQGETRGMSLIEHYDALMAHGMGGMVNYLLMHDSSVDERVGISGVKRVAYTDEDIAAIEKAGTRVLLRDLADTERPSWHNPAKLRHAFSEVL